MVNLYPNNSVQADTSVIKVCLLFSASDSSHLHSLSFAYVSCYELNI